MALDIGQIREVKQEEVENGEGKSGLAQAKLVPPPPSSTGGGGLPAASNHTATRSELCAQEFPGSQPPTSPYTLLKMWGLLDGDGIPRDYVNDLCLEINVGSRPEVIDSFDQERFHSAACQWVAKRQTARRQQELQNQQLAQEQAVADRWRFRDHCLGIACRLTPSDIKAGWLRVLHPRVLEWRQTWSLENPEWPDFTEDEWCKLESLGARYAKV
jgi:hypothetical protein